MSSSINLNMGFNSSGGAGSPFARPSTANLRRYSPVKKTRVVEVNEQNMYALVNEMYDLRNRSYFDQRLLKVSELPRPLTIGGGTVERSKRGAPSATPKHNANK